MRYVRGLAAVGAEVYGELVHRLVVMPGGAKQQPLGVQVVHDGDVVLPTTQAGLVDAHDAHLAHVLFAPGLVDVVLDTPKIASVCAASRGHASAGLAITL